MYGPLASNFRTASLRKSLGGALSSIEKLDRVDYAGPDGADLHEQIKDLLDVTILLDDLATRRRKNLGPIRSFSATDLLHLETLANNVSTIAQECLDFSETLQASLQDTIQASDVTSGGRLGEQVWFGETCQAFKLRTETLRALLSATNVVDHKDDVSEDGNLSSNAQAFASTLQYQIALLKPKLDAADRPSTPALQRAVAAATAVSLRTPVALNKHFLVGRSVKTFYTGRGEQMAILEAAYGQAEHPGRKIFVVYGLGGSGKTELALKYAESHRENFWGVFLVDGSSRKNASGSYAEIAKIGGVEPNEKAAKNWLATRALPWLLIIDNVDDEEVQLEVLLPAGTKGCVLVTSRNPNLKSYGTVGRRYLELLPMDMEEANELILKAAEEPSPWTKPVKDSASLICQALGFLPLALVHAGKAILHNLCSWGAYLTYYDYQTQKIRRDRLHRRDRSLSRNSSRYQEDDDGMNVFSSYEILYQSLEGSQKESFQDAVELLQMFSYHHYQNIRLDEFVNAATNPFIEAGEREKEARKDAELTKKLATLAPGTWTRWLRELALSLLQYLETPPAIPDALKNPYSLSGANFAEEVQLRLRAALAVLVSRSLVMKQDRLEDRYSMHPLVHKWVRERPETSISQQALWCQVTTTTLARSILLPPLGDAENERSMRRELLPHIMHVRNCQAIIKERLIENQSRRTSIWPMPKPEFGKLQAIEAARFSRVYSECGLFNEALQLQSKVRDFLFQVLGEQHLLSIKVTLFRVSTLWELGRTKDATESLRHLYEACMKSLGDDHPMALTVTDLLGSSACFQGRLSEALYLHQKAVDGMKRVYGDDHENTFKAINNIARVHLRYMDFEKATEYYELAWKGMKKAVGDTHIDTLICEEDLAMARIRLGTKHLPISHEMMTFVLEQRRKILGKEQPYTLLAICNLARVKSAMGQHDEAATMMRDAISTAERNLGEDHSGVLAGKAHYAQVLVHQRRFDEAERIFHSVVEKPQYQKTSGEDGEHPDRMIALWYLAGCLEKQGKFQGALDICESLVSSLREIGGKGLGPKHKFASTLRDKIARLEEKIQGNAPATEEDLDTTSGI